MRKFHGNYKYCASSWWWCNTDHVNCCRWCNTDQTSSSVVHFFETLIIGYFIYILSNNDIDDSNVLGRVLIASIVCWIIHYLMQCGRLYRRFKYRNIELSNKKWFFMFRPWSFLCHLLIMLLLYIFGTWLCVSFLPIGSDNCNNMSVYTCYSAQIISVIAIGWNAFFGTYCSVSNSLRDHLFNR